MCALIKLPEVLTMVHTQLSDTIFIRERARRTNRLNIIELSGNTTTISY